MSRTQEQLQQLQRVLHEPANNPIAQQLFANLIEQVAVQSPLGSQLAQMLWEEIQHTQRSLNFWRGLGEAEGDLAKAYADQNIHLQQNYLRLLREQ